MMMEKGEKVIRLIMGYMKGELDEPEQKELKAWRMISIRNEEIFQRMISSEHWDDSLRRFLKSPEEAGREWEKIRLRATGRGRRAYLAKWARYVAAAMITLLLGGTIYYFTTSAGKEEVLLAANPIVRPEGVPVLVFPDGTQLELTASPEGNLIAGDRPAWFYTEKGLTVPDTDGEDSAPSELHTIRVPRGGEFVLVLSDSTTVFLNAETELVFPVPFSDSERRVQLTGEAYFHVKQSQGKPFIVEASSMEIEVLGTSFNVRAYNDEQNIRTVLEKGKIKVSAGEAEEILRPHTLAQFDRTTEVFEVMPVDVALHTSWKNGRMVFDNAPLEEVLRELARWYSFRVEYLNDAAKDVSFSLNIKKHEAFSEILQLIEATGNVHFEIDNQTVFVK